MSNKKNRKQEKNNLIISNLVNSIKKTENLLSNKYSESHTLNKVKSSKKIKEKEYYIGKYLIQNTLGQGTFGKVKMGIYSPTGEKVAVKIFKKDELVEDEYKMLVKREFDILEKLNHPNVIFVEEIFETNYYYYNVMEYCDGGELFNYIIKNRRLNDDESAFFYFQLINGLEYIHSLGIVHRDLKPENILLTKEKILKINDFGLSNYFKEGQKKLLSTQCGSLCYSSPEMIKGKKYNGFKIDIWATGIILYSMLCGYLPFEDNDKDILLKKIEQCIISFPKYIKKDAKDLIKKILVIDPEKRIDIKNIKRHPFYLKGKEIFEKKFDIHGIFDYEKPLNEIRKSLEINKEKERGKMNESAIKKDEKNKENIQVEKSKDNKKNNEIHKNNVEEESNKNNLITEYKENNNNLVENIMNNLVKENKKTEQKEKSKKKSINKKNTMKDNIIKKNDYIKNKELLFTLNNKQKIENKLNLRNNSHENKIKDKIVNNNKFKTLLTKKKYINISQKINSLFNIKKRRKKDLNYNKLIIKNNNLTKLLSERQLLKANNNIDIERLFNEKKRFSNFQKMTSENKGKKIKITNKNKNDNKSKLYESNINKKLPNFFNSSQNLKQSSDGKELFNYRFNKDRNSRNKNYKKELYKSLEDKNKFISKRENYTKYRPKIKKEAHSNNTSKKNYK